MISLILATILTVTTLVGPGVQPHFDVEKFVLPKEAHVLVASEADSKETCKVYVYERTDSDKPWVSVMCINGNIGHGGMSYNRKVGDGSTPVGVWMLNTPFGQKPKMDGFPDNYVQVSKDYVWSDSTNKLEKDPEWKLKGERVGTDSYKSYYNYSIDSGYNKNAVKDKGSALFIHCQKSGENTTSSGCIKIPEKAMIDLMKLYGKYGDGKCFIAQGISDEMDVLYNAYGTNNGLEAVKK